MLLSSLALPPTNNTFKTLHVAPSASNAIVSFKLAVLSVVATL